MTTAPLVELLLIALVVALITERTGRPYSVALVIWGLALGFIAFEPIDLTRELVLAVFLPPLLFEGALNVGAAAFRRQLPKVIVLTVGGGLLTTAAVGVFSSVVLGLDLLVGLLLGAMLAATDPVAVLATFRANRVAEDLRTIVEGESLFNDSIAVVLYLMLLAAVAGAPPTASEALAEFGWVLAGGLAVGLALGLLTAWVLRHIAGHLVQITWTIILAYGAYVAAEAVHASGVVAVAAAGLVFAAVGRDRLEPTPRSHVLLTWEVVAFLVNSIVFLLIGLELHPERLWQQALPIVGVFTVVLAARAVVVYGMGFLAGRRGRDFPPAWRHVVVWSGLRGAVPVALALGLPAGMPERASLTSLVFGVVLVSLLVQGLTIPALLRSLGLSEVPATTAAAGEGEAER